MISAIRSEIGGGKFISHGTEIIKLKVEFILAVLYGIERNGFT